MPSLHPSANIHALHSFPTRRSSDLGIDILPKQKTIIIGKINYKHNPSFSFRSTFFINNADTAYNNWHKTNYFFEGYHSNAHSFQDRKSTRLNSSHVKISYAVFCLKK